MSKITRGQFLQALGRHSPVPVHSRQTALRHCRLDTQQPSTPSGWEDRASSPTSSSSTRASYTIDPALPRAEAFAVKDGRFLAVGSNADIRNLATARTRVIDAAGMTRRRRASSTRTVTRAASTSCTTVERATCGRMRELQARSAKKAAQDAAGILGQRATCSTTRSSDASAAPPRSRRGVARASDRRRIIAAATRAGTTARRSSSRASRSDTPDPDHGRFFRDADGELDRPRRRAARATCSATVGQRERFTPEQQRERGRNGMRAHLGAAHGRRPHDGARRRRRSRQHPRLRGRARATASCATART